MFSLTVSLPFLKIFTQSTAITTAQIKLGKVPRRGPLPKHILVFLPWEWE